MKEKLKKEKSAKIGVCKSCGEACSGDEICKACTIFKELKL
jgi:hypothetical protein